MRSPLLLPNRYDSDLRFLGRGGFAEVFLTHDRLTGRDVAVKVPSYGDRADLARQASTELRAAASLRHPNIVQVVDAGQTPDGWPYLVMEYASEGSMAALIQSPPEWSELFPVLVGILDGLAHAHAAGLIHRDIKSENVLLTSDSSGRVRPVISDFGLAKVVDRSGSYAATRLQAGTVLYMAPEQFSDDVGAIHPAADLYAFGVLLYLLVGGKRPWPGESTVALIYGKATGETRPLVARAGYSVPEGLGSIIERLLSPDPWDRPANAAEVRDGLLHLGRRLPAVEPPGSGGGDEESVDESIPRPPDPLHLIPPPAPAAPIERWPPTLALGAVREPLLVGRESERERLWQLATSARVQAAGVELTGPAGAGRSRLGRWLLRGLEEGGHGRSLHVRVDASMSPNRAVARALRHRFGLGRHAHDELRRRLLGWSALGDAESAAELEMLVAWLSEAVDATASRATEPDEPERRLAALHQVLRSEARAGIACVWIEEVDEEAGGRRLADSLLKGAIARGYPLFVLFEGPGARSGEDRSDRRLGRLEVAPLEDAHIRDLVVDLVAGLDDDALEAVVTRSRGLPSLAVEWARLAAQRAVTLATLGLTDADTESPVSAEPRISTPAALAGLTDTLSIGSIADERVGAVLEGLGAADPREGREAELALLLMALLPQPVAPATLMAAMQAVGGGARLQALLGDLRDAGLVRAFPDGGLAFDGAPVAQACRTRAEGDPERTALLLAAAEVLLGGPDEPDASTKAHAGRLLFEAGDVERALDVQEVAAQALLPRDLEASKRAWEGALRCVDTLGLPPTDARRARASVGASRAARALGDLDGAEALLERLDGRALPVLERARVREAQGALLLHRGRALGAVAAADEALAAFEEAEDLSGQALAAHLRAAALDTLGRAEQAEAAFQAALAMAQRAGAEAVELHCRWRLARCRWRARDRAAARAGFEEALEMARRLGDVRVEGISLRELGNLALNEGRQDEADALLQESGRRLASAGAHAEATGTRVSRGELVRAQGRLREAREEYAAALLAADAYGIVSTAVVALFDLGITEFQMGRPRRAARRVRELDRRIPPGEPSRYRPYLEALRLACLATDGAWEQAEDTLDGLAATELPPDKDLLQLVEIAAQAAAGASQLALASDLFALAAELAARAGDEEASDRVRNELSMLAAGRGSR